MIPFAALILIAALQQTPSLESPSPKERIEAVEGLSRIGRTENVPPLAEALRKESRGDVRAAIVAGLARIGGREVVPILTAALASDLDKDVRLQVIDSLQRLYINVETPGPIRTVFNKVRSVFAESDRPVVQNPAAVDPAVNAALAEAMQKDFNREVRTASARALGSLRARDRVAVLVSSFQSPQMREYPDVRLEIASSLGLIRDPAAGPALVSAVRDTDRKISRAAILSLGLIGFKDARPVLEDVFRTDRAVETRTKALESIALMRDPGALPLFESMLGHGDAYYRELATEGLARIDHDPGVLTARWETEKKANVRNALAFALVAADRDEYFNDLANALDSRQAYQAEVYIYELGKFEGKLPELHRYLRSENPKVRARMTKILGDIGDPSSRPLVEQMTEDKNSEVAREALSALRKLTVG